MQKRKVIKVMFTIERMINARDNSLKYPTHREFVNALFMTKGYRVIAHQELKYFPVTKGGKAYGMIVEGNPGLSIESV